MLTPMAPGSRAEWFMEIITEQQSLLGRDVLSPATDFLLCYLQSCWFHQEFNNSNIDLSNSLL